MNTPIERKTAVWIPPANRRSQHGMALVFALIVLLILTILGVSSLHTASLEQLMSGNVQELTRAFEAADSGLSRAINDMQTNTSTVDPTKFVTITYTYTLPSTIVGENSTAKATVETPKLIQIGPAPRSSAPTGSNVCAAYYDQKVTGTTNNSLAQENLHQGLTTGAPCPAGS